MVILSLTLTSFEDNLSCPVSRIAYRGWSREFEIYWLCVLITNKKLNLEAKKKKKKLHPDLPISAIAIRILIPRQGKGNIDVFLRLFKTPKDKVLK
jgi:hypothetical protein